MTIEPYRDSGGTIVGILGTAADITELIRQQSIMEGENARLDRVVGERTAELQAANSLLHSLTQSIVTIQEEERRRISRELHDEAGQMLTAIKMSLEVMHAEMPPDTPGLRDRINEIVSLIATTLGEIRTLAQDLRPAALDTMHIDEVLEGLCREFKRRGRMRIEYHGTRLPHVGDATSVTLYRFLQEALTNVVKHAHANEVRVRLEKSEQEITLSVQDNGRGFDVKSKPHTLKQKRLGLIGMQERLAGLGGWLEVDSQPGQGTRLVAHIAHKEAE
jgi:signal transduction histidine kinase